MPTSDVPTLLRTFIPRLDPHLYVFATLSPPTPPEPWTTALAPLANAALMCDEPHKHAKTYILPLSTTHAIFAELAQASETTVSNVIDTADVSGIARHGPNEAEASASFRYEFPCRRLTIDVESALAGVGFMVVLLGALAARGIGVNGVSGFWSDHFYVASQRAEEAVEVLEGVRAQARAEEGMEVLEGVRARARAEAGGGGISDVCGFHGMDI